MAVTAQMVKELREKTGAGMLDCKKALEASNGVMEDAITWLREKGIAKAAKKEGRVAAEGLCNVVVKGNKAVLFELNSETDFVSKNQQFLNTLALVGEIIMDSNATTTEEALAVEKDGKSVATLLIEATSTIGEKISLRRVSVVNKNDDEVFGAYKHMGGRIVTLTVVKGADESVAKDVAMHAAAMSPKYLSQNDISAEEIEKEKAIQTELAKNDPKNAGKPDAIIEKMIAGRLMKGFKEVCLVDQPFVKNPDLTVGKYVESQKGQIVQFVRLQVGEGIEKVSTDFAAEVAAQMKA